jgi:hypothetical protein
MPFVLAEAQWRAMRRRIGRVAAANPIIALGVLVMVLASPLAMVFAGRTSGRALGDSLSHLDVAQSLTVTMAFVTVLTGCILAVLAPGEKALGEQLAAAPLSRGQRFWGMTAIPVLCVIGMLAAFATLFALPFAAAGPGGVPAGFAMLAMSGGGLTIGAVLVQATVGFRRGALWGLMALAGVGLGWPLCGLLADGPIGLGVFGWLPEVLAGQQSVTAVTVLGLCLAAAFATMWVALCLHIPPETPVQRLRTRRPLLPTHFIGAVVALGLVRVIRRRELRHQALLVVAATIGGALLLHSVVPASLGFIFVFCATTAIVGAAISPLAVAGLDARGQWMWNTVPISRRQRAVASHASALLAGWTILVMACAPLAALADISTRVAIDVGVLSAMVFSAALVAGTVLPWKEAAGGEQMASYAIFMIIAGFCWTALGWIGRQAVDQGLPEPLVAATLPTLAVCAGIALSAHLVTKEPT